MSLTSQRSRQIASLRQHISAAVQVDSRDDSHWTIQLVNTKMEELYKFSIHLTPSFPNSPPDIRVDKLVEHPWQEVSSTRLSENPTLKQWHANCNLGLLVSDIVREFSTKKPASRTSGAPSVARVLVGSPSRESLAVPPVPADFPGVRAMSESDLEQLDANMSTMDLWVENYDLVVQYKSILRDVVGVNAKIAANTLENKTVLDDLASAANEKFLALCRERESLRKVQDERAKVESQFSPESLREDLLRASDRAERAATEIWDEFIRSGTGSFAAVKTQIFAQRLLQHKAKAKAELLASLS